MQDEYPKALAVILKYEGGKVNDPYDPGGKTNQGITQRTYDAYRKGLKRPAMDVFAMSDVERDAIYKEQYWDKVDGDKLPPGIGFALFDGAVNSGVAQSVKWIQGALGKIYQGKIDGIMGDKTIAAIKSINDHDALIDAMENRRLDFLKALKTWERYKNGWTARVYTTRTMAQAWARGSIGPEVIYAEGMEAKAPLDEAKPLPYKAWIDAILGGGAALAAGTAALQTQIDAIQQQLGPFLNGPLGQSMPWLLTINHWLTVAGVVAAALAGVYRFYITNYDAKLKAALDLRTGLEKPEEREST